MTSVKIGHCQSRRLPLISVLVLPNRHVIPVNILKFRRTVPSLTQMQLIPENNFIQLSIINRQLVLFLPRPYLFSVRHL